MDNYNNVEYTNSEKSWESANTGVQHLALAVLEWGPGEHTDNNKHDRLLETFLEVTQRQWHNDMWNRLMGYAGGGGFDSEWPPVELGRRRQSQRLGGGIASVLHLEERRHLLKLMVDLRELWYTWLIKVLSTHSPRTSHPAGDNEGKVVYYIWNLYLIC